MTPEQLTGLTSSHLAPMMIGAKSWLVHPDVQADLQQLIDAAHSAGFDCTIASSFRDFQRQCSIWNRKFSGTLPVLDDISQPLDINSLSPEELVFAILRWSALPGASRHHWGSDFDIYCRKSLDDHPLKLEPWEYQTGHQAQFSHWLTSYLPSSNFFLPYAKDLGGVNIEPWHISHRKVATQCLQQLDIKQLDSIIESQPILGKEIVRQQLETIYNRFIIAINQ